MKKIMKKTIAIMLCTVAAVSIISFTDTIHPQKVEASVDDELPNPMVEYDTIEDAQKVVGFDVKEISNIPKGYKQDKIYVIDNKLIEITYKNGEKQICYRIAKETGDISGDYNNYKKNYKVTVNGTKVIMKGNHQKINVAIWSKDDLAYSITTQGLAKKVVTNMIKSVLSKKQSELPNPMVEYATIEDAEKIVGFDVKGIGNIPEGYKQEKIYVIANSTVEILYTNTKNEICYRVAKTTSDISGDYNNYTEINKVTVNDVNIITKGNNSTINLATWTDHGFSFSLGMNEFNKDAVIKIISSIQ